MNQQPIFILEEEPLIPDISYAEIGLPDDVQDGLRYLDYLIEIGETILHTGETQGTSKIRKSVYNEFKEFIHAYHHVHEGFQNYYLNKDDI
jgi:hypothetical protein